MSRTDPRVTRTLELVRRAAVGELAERGWGSFTIESVAARAGVARSTVYRHWPDRLALLVDALEHHSTQPAAPPGGTARQRVEQLLAHLAEVYADPRRSAMTVGLIDVGEREPEVRAIGLRFGKERRQALVDALAAGVSSGELHALDPELTAVALAGAVVYRRVMTERPLAPDEVPALVASVLGPEQPTSP